MDPTEGQRAAATGAFGAPNPPTSRRAATAPGNGTAGWANAEAAAIPADLASSEPAAASAAATRDDDEANANSATATAATALAESRFLAFFLALRAFRAAASAARTASLAAALASAERIFFALDFSDPPAATRGNSRGTRCATRGNSRGARCATPASTASALAARRYSRDPASSLAAVRAA